MQHFALPHPVVEGMGDSVVAITQLKLFPGGRGVRGSFNLHFNLNLLLSQNYQVHIRESGKISVLPLFTFRETVPICYHRSCLFREVCEFPEKDVWGPESR